MNINIIFLTAIVFLVYLSGFLELHSGHNVASVVSATTVTPVLLGSNWQWGYRRTGWKLQNPEKNAVYVREEHECILSCHLQNPKCGAVYFNKITNRCRHMYGEYTLLLKGTSDDVFIFGSRLIGIYVTEKYNDNQGNGMNFDLPTAISVCEELHGSLSTRAHLQTMYDDGVKHCWCGWLADGTQGYVNQAKLSWCDTTLGVFYDCVEPLAHAWCTIIHV